MEIYFYEQKMDRKCVDKDLNTNAYNASTNPRGYKHKCTATIKENSSIENPILEIAYDPDLASCNYMYIPDWNRYYFIDDMTVATQRMFVSGHIDVLYTNKNAIYNMKAVICRSAMYGNLWQNDKYFRINQYNNNEEIDFEYSPFSNKAHSYVLVVAGAIPTS